MFKNIVLVCRFFKFSFMKALCLLIKDNYFHAKDNFWRKCKNRFWRISRKMNRCTHNEDSCDSRFMSYVSSYTMQQ